MSGIQWLREDSKFTMPVLPNLVRGDQRKISNLLIYVLGIDDNALRQYHRYI